MAKILDVSIEIVRERVRVLRRRDQVGRTGVFTLISVGPDEQFEAVLKRLTASKPEMRRLQRVRTGR